VWNGGGSHTYICVRYTAVCCSGPTRFVRVGECAGYYRAVDVYNVPLRCWALSDSCSVTDTTALLQLGFLTKVSILSNCELTIYVWTDWMLVLHFWDGSLPLFTYIWLIWLERVGQAAAFNVPWYMWYVFFFKLFRPLPVNSESTYKVRRIFKDD